LFFRSPDLPVRIPPRLRGEAFVFPITRLLDFRKPDPRSSKRGRGFAFRITRSPDPGFLRASARPW
jgi:hypothetical protein